MYIHTQAKHAYLNDEIFFFDIPDASRAAGRLCTGLRETARTAGGGAFGLSTGCIYYGDKRTFIHTATHTPVHPTILLPHPLCMHSPVSPSIHLCIHTLSHPPIHTSIHTSIRPSASTNLSIHLSIIHIHIHPAAHQRVHPPTHPRIYPFFYASIYAPIHRPSH